MEITVSRKAHFNAAHRLFNKEWSEKKNSQVFGKCNYPNYHGHNYELIVSGFNKYVIGQTFYFYIHLRLLVFHTVHEFQKLSKSR